MLSGFQGQMNPFEMSHCRLLGSIKQLWPYHGLTGRYCEPEVLELYRERASREVADESKVLWRAFGKATWREPRGFAADADPMQIE